MEVLTLNHEPPLKAGDTQPRRPVAPAEDEERRGCANPLLAGLVALMLLGMIASMLALSAYLGYRDGGIVRRTQNAVALFGTLDWQATRAWQDLAESSFALADARCQYLIGVRPEYPGLRNCISTAQAALSATPTFTPSPLPSATPPPTTAPVIATPGAVTAEQLFSRAQDQINAGEYEAARKTLEALRGLDVAFRRSEVEALLVTVYLTLAQRYEFEGRLAELIQVVTQAERLRNLSADPNTQKWPITKDAASLYLSAKGYLRAENYGTAAQVFRTMMTRDYRLFLDTKTLACEAFTKAGDAAALQQYCA
jgi:type II secretory pathway pseudopilin PulG